jgi:pimeloyl-ACP methyl ester carboxylesterase
MNAGSSWLRASDGTRIAYRVQGSGPALVLTNGLTTSTVFWKHVAPIWARRHSVLSWDLPGHGASGPAQSPESASVEAQARFVVQLMAAAGIERAVQVGWSTGCQVVLESYRHAPERCEALVLILGSAGRVLDTTRLPLDGALIAKLVRFTPRPVFRALYRTLSRGTLAPFGDVLGRKLGLIGAGAAREDVRDVLEHIPTVDPGTLQTLLWSLSQHDATDALVSARVPSLIIAGDADPFAPADLVGIPLHEASPHSELVRLPEATHTALLDHALEIAEAVEDFVGRAVGDPSGDSNTA